MTPTPTEEKWITKETAGEILALGVRRVEDLLHLQSWPTKKEKVDGKRLAVTMVRESDVKAYKNGLGAPTINVGAPETAIERREKPGQGSGVDKLALVLATRDAGLQELGATIVGLAGRLAVSFAPPATRPYHRMTITEAARHIGMPRWYVTEACESGRLPFVWLGREGSPRRKRMIRVDHLERLDLE